MPHLWSVTDKVFNPHRVILFDQNVLSARYIILINDFIELKLSNNDKMGLFVPEKQKKIRFVKKISKTG